ncbi:MAG: CHAT domain-containing protein [Thermoanaerobaculia bacterium]|nr:CHAT domain-containing protein [Thermoanaerobaculia bacterium]
MEYQNITLAFQDAGAGKLSLRLSGCGATTQPIDLERLESLLPTHRPAAEPGSTADKTRDVLRRQPQLPVQPEEVGTRLFEMLFVGEIRELFCQQLDAVQKGERGLRLRLALDVTSPVLRRLQDLPWELLYYPGWACFLGLDRRFSLVRSLDVPRPGGFQPAALPLRCLVVGSSPKGLEPLNLRSEAERIDKALEGEKRIHAEHVPKPTAEKIRERLLASHCQIVHFAGHGYDDNNGRGLVLEDDEGSALRIDAARWAEHIADVQPSLVVLNACSTARPSGSASQPFHGVAQALLRAGVPAVIAMREPILDRAGLVLAKTLYGRLAAGDPLDAALVEVRKALRLQLPERSDWAIPALFLLGEGGRIFAEPGKSIEPGPVAEKHQETAFVEVEKAEDDNEIIAIEEHGVERIEGNQRAEVKVGTVRCRNKIVGIQLHGTKG